ncbi:MAG: hypothetical protein UCM69_03860 [Dialister invisus]|jgi:hypothetical protein|nr:hypothetical protein [Dialister invisus]DAM54931.1 MAG TPA: Peptidoglycan endopeptidase [Caudoviricetes sp.]
MWKIRKGLILSAVLLSLWLSPLLSGSHAQAEVQYTISETDLTTLETSLNQLKIDSEKKDKLLIQQQTQLTEAQKQLKIVNEQLKKSKVLNEQTENSLKIARESFNEYEKEAERKVKIKTKQRNMWIIISAVAVGAAISRR